jgi:hypothetical protein
MASEGKESHVMATEGNVRKGKEWNGKASQGMA